MVSTAQAPSQTASLSRKVAAAFGAVFVILGLVGFTVSGGHDAIGTEGGHLLGLFEVNVAHNLVHLVVGIALIAAAALSNSIAKLANIVVGAVYLLVAVIGLIIINGDLNILALNGLDNGLHVVVGGALLAAGLVLDRKSTQ